MTAHRRRDLLITLVIAVVSSIYYLSYFNYDINPSDEGYLCYGTHRVLEGRTPGADFHAYEPGRYWFLASFFAVFGEDVVVERAVLLILRVLICVFAYRAARVFLPVPVALIACTPTLLVPGPWHKSWFSLAVLIAFVSAQRFLRRQENKMVWAGGLIVGTACVFRLDLGVFTGLLWGGALIGSSCPSERCKVLPVQVGRFVAGALFPIAAACSVLAIQGGLKDALTFYVSEYINATGGLERIHPKIEGFPSLLGSIVQAPQEWLGLVIWLTIASGLLLACTVVLHWRRSPSSGVALSLLFIAWACSVIGVVVQPDRSHLLQNGPVLWIAIATSVFMFEREIRRRFAGREQHRSWLSMSVTSVVFAALIGENLFAGGINSYYTGSIRMRFGPHAPSGIAGASLEIDPWVAEEYREILDFINRRTRPGDGLATCFCLPMFNFLSERENPTGLDILFPHTIGRTDQQERFINNLVDVRLFVVNTCEFSRIRPDHCPPDDHTLEDFAPAVVNHIRDQWRPVFTSKHGFATIYARRDR